MIEVTGIAGTPEHTAAVYLADQLARLWPGLRDSAAAIEKVCIAANVKLTGYGVGDVDIVLAACFRSGERNFRPRSPVMVKDSGHAELRPVNVRNLIVAIEVKDHDAGAVRYAGDSVEVLYTKRGRQEWKGATEQNINQVHAIADYFRDVIGDKPFVHRALIMQGLAEVRAAGVLPAGYDALSFLAAIAATSGGARRGPSGLVLSSTSDVLARFALAAPIFVPVRPTALDRRRMDAVASNAREAPRIEEAFGEKLLRLRGTGGTGKTVMLLHAAWAAFRARGLRTMFLTYNLALAADIRRTMTLMGVPSSPEEGGIKVQSVMAFMSSWMRRLGTIAVDGVAIEHYESNCVVTLELLRGGAVQSGDIAGIKGENPEAYDFGTIVVDEAQDCPQVEADLLKALYVPNQIALADGVDQMVRRDVATDWDRGVAPANRLLITLGECLRMKRNLAVFLNVVAELGGAGPGVRPSEAAGGGKVVILRRPYRDYPDLHAELLAGAGATGNAEVDILHCVPWSRGPAAHSARRDIVADLRGMGASVWDGTDKDVRQQFPRSSKEHRVVHYESCRGLEGWIVALHDADTYFADCERYRAGLGLSADEQASYADLAQLARAYAWRRMMIAMTRPIDTLVLTISDVPSAFTGALVDAARRCRDFVDVRD
jgi:hypothetical protein